MFRAFSHWRIANSERMLRCTVIRRAQHRAFVPHHSAPQPLGRVRQGGRDRVPPLDHKPALETSTAQMSRAMLFGSDNNEAKAHI